MPVLGPALNIAAILVGRRWLPLIVATLLAGVAGSWATDLALDAAPAGAQAANITQWLVDSAADAILVTMLLAILRPWPTAGERIAVWARWTATVLLLQLLVKAPDLLIFGGGAPAPGGSGVTVEFVPADPSGTTPDPGDIGPDPLAMAGAALGLALLGVFSLAPAAAVLEERDVVAALRRSLVFLPKAWPSLLALLGVIAVVVVVMGLAAAIAPMAMAGFNQGPGRLMDPLMTATATIFCAGVFLRIRVLVEPQPEATADVFD